MSGETLLNGRYRLVSQQGSGGMAVIYKAVDESLGRTVAIKILRPSLTADVSFVVRFQNEARSIANMSHPNIVTVHDVGNDGPTHYIVMEFVDGQDLKKQIRAHGALSVERALNIAIGMCAGVGFAHRAGIVHADVKPQNILLTRDELVKVTDFGIAQAWTDTQPTERQSVVWGSPHYFSPEQARGERPTAASDVYSIGIVMFEMLTGRLPYTGSDQQELALAHIREAVPLVTEFNPAVPESLAKIVLKVMSKEPGARYRMADQLGHILISYRDRGREHTVPGAARNAEPPAASPTVPHQSVVPPPPAAQPQQQRPQTPPPAPESMPTIRYDAAPHAPNPVVYGRPPAQSDSRNVSQPTAPGMPRMGGDSRPLAPPRQYSRPMRAQEDEPFQLDAVTIALGIIAFMAVACLIPLYIVALAN